MRAKPDFLGTEHAAMFLDPDVAAAYASRPPYPAALFPALVRLADPSCPDALDAGCGTGDLARPLAARLRRVDAVDPSHAMVDAGRRLPGGDRRNLRWIVAAAETAPLDPPYGIVVAGQSLAWMAWDVVLGRWASALSNAGHVALVERTQPGAPWEADLRAAFARHSVNRTYRPYDLVDELTTRSLFRVEGREEIAAVAVPMALSTYVEGLHSMNGLDRRRLGLDGAAAFDAEALRVVSTHARDGILTVPAGAEIVWGRPAP